MVAFVALPSLLLLLTLVSVPLRVLPYHPSDLSGGILPHVASPLATCPILKEPLPVSTPPFGCPSPSEVITRAGVLIDSHGRVADAWLTGGSQSAGAEHERCVLNALRRWQYAPAQDCDDIAVPFVSRLTFVVPDSDAAWSLSPATGVRWP